MKKLKNQKGITLVALIITIIILLILAVVALREITGDGIIAKAKEARTRYETEQGEENTILSDYEDEIEQAISGGNQVTGKAYKISNMQFIIITSDNRSIVVDGDNVREYQITDLENLTVTDAYGVVLEDMVFERFFNVEDIWIMGIAGNTLYNFERAGEEGNYTYRIQASFNYDESIEVGDYL